MPDLSTDVSELPGRRHDMARATRSLRRRDPDAPFLIPFHEDGRRPGDAVKLGRHLWPGAPVAALCGRHAQRAGWRHLEKHAAEPADLFFEASGIDLLAGEVWELARREDSLIERVAVGIGGGADAVLGLLCRHPALFACAVLCRPARRWSRASLEEVEPGNGVEVLIVTDAVGLGGALAAQVMLSAARHNAEVVFATREEEMTLIRRWLHHELRGESDNDDE